MRVMANPYQTSYQAAAELNQALGPGPSMPPPPARAPTAYGEPYRVSPSPPPVHLLPYGHEPTAPVHPEQQRASALKRKDPDVSGSLSVGKRRRADEDDEDDGGGGAKHWSDDDKQRLFSWLMAPGNDEHFNMLRSSKNNCLRECALEVFGGKKTFQALKGAFERAFVTFKQIYAFEAFTAHLRTPGMNPASQTDRHRDWEKRILSARKGGFDVGSLSVRVLEQWHRTGWYEMFYNRWHGDPMTTKPIVRLGQSIVPQMQTDEDDHGEDPDEHMQDHTTANADLPEREQSVQLLAPPPLPPPHGPPGMGAAYTPVHGVNGINPFGVPTPEVSALPDLSRAGYPTDQTLQALVGLTQNMMASFTQLMTQMREESRANAEISRKREERELEMARARREEEKRKADREQADWERVRERDRERHKTTLAQETLANTVDPGVKAAAAEYLKRIFQD